MKSTAARAGPVSALCAFAMLGAAGCQPADAPGERATLELSPCQLAAPSGRGRAAAQCGTLTVAENRDDPASRRIALRVAVAPADRHDPARPPLFVLAGGPGQAATDFYAAYEPVFMRLRRRQDIVLVDQRGTGGSNALACAAAPDETDTDPAALRARASECLERLTGDPRYYTTSVAVRDLEDARAALGYETITIYAVSYGTRVAQQYLRRHPDRVRALVLDGAVPPEVILGPDTALEAQRALDLILKRCRDDDRCGAAFPDVEAILPRLRARLARAPVEITTPDPTTAQPTQVELGTEELAAALRILSYSDDTAAMLPLLLHAADEARFGPLAAQYMMVSRRLEDQLAEGMHNAVVCSEDVPFIARDTVAAASTATTYLGTLQLDGLRAICSVWPRGVVDPDLHDPLEITVPLLLLSGEADPVTPPRYAEQVLAHATRALHLVLPGHGHGQIASPCVNRLVARFLATGDPDRLDTRCVADVRPAPFFLDFTGTAP